MGRHPFPRGREEGAALEGAGLSSAPTRIPHSEERVDADLKGRVILTGVELALSGGGRGAGGAEPVGEVDAAAGAEQGRSSGDGRGPGLWRGADLGARELTGRWAVLPQGSVVQLAFVAREVVEFERGSRRDAARGGLRLPGSDAAPPDAGLPAGHPAAREALTPCPVRRDGGRVPGGSVRPRVRNESFDSLLDKPFRAVLLGHSSQSCCPRTSPSVQDAAP